MRKCCWLFRAFANYYCALLYILYRNIRIMLVDSNKLNVQWVSVWILYHHFVVFVPVSASAIILKQLTYRNKITCSVTDYLSLELTPLIHFSTSYYITTNMAAVRFSQILTTQTLVNVVSWFVVVICLQVSYNISRLYLLKLSKKRVTTQDPYLDFSLMTNVINYRC
jgi:hypothetical protein